MAPRYTLANLSPDESQIVQRALTVARDEGRTLRWVALKLLEAYADGDINAEGHECLRCELCNEPAMTGRSVCLACSTAR